MVTKINRAPPSYHPPTIMNIIIIMPHPFNILLYQLLAILVNILLITLQSNLLMIDIIKLIYQGWLMMYTPLNLVRKQLMSSIYILFVAIAIEILLYICNSNITIILYVVCLILSIDK